MCRTGLGSKVDEYESDGAGVTPLLKQPGRCTEAS